MPARVQSKTASKIPTKKTSTAPGLRASEFKTLAQKRLLVVLEAARQEGALLRRGARGEVELEILGSARMRTINREFREKDKSTDVLSFPAPEFYRKHRTMPRLGELLICLPVLKKQAREVGHSERVELDVLLVHGVLHLLGFDHELGGGQARTMARWEARLLGALGRKVGLIDRQGAS